MNRKERQLQRYLRQQKHHRTQEEEKALDRERRERKAGRRRRPPRKRDWDVDDDPVVHDGARPGPVRRRTVDVSGTAGVQGRVLSVWRDALLVEVDGQERRVPLGRDLDGTPVVNDRVRLVERGGREVVAALEPRRSWLARPVPSRPDRDRLFAANVDVAVCVVSLREPDFRPRLVDRALVLARRGGVEPVIVVSKVDLADSSADLEALEEHLAAYRDLDLAVHVVSIRTGAGLAALRASLEGRSVVLFGQSGVGKSSLVNALSGEERVVTGRVRAGDGKGRHTTTVSRVHALPGGLRLIDTPGIRALGLSVLDLSHLREAFPEFEAAGCRFSDCTHDAEPGCGVRAAVEAGELPAHRLRAWLRLGRSLSGDR